MPSARHQLLSGIAGLLLAIGCSTSTPPRLRWQVAAESVGLVRFGMRPSDAATVLGIKPETAFPDSSCGYWIPREAPAGVSLMIEDGKLVRIDVDSPGVVTSFGLQVGSPADSVRSVFGTKLRDQPHKYNWEDGWRYLMTFTSDSLYGLVFEVDSHVVRKYRAGLWPQVGYVEHCS